MPFIKILRFVYAAQAPDTNTGKVDDICIASVVDFWSDPTTCISKRTFIS